MRQTNDADAIIDAAGIVVGPGPKELLSLLQELRPWSDERLVAKRLRSWADWYWGVGALTPRDADGAAEVAAQLSIWGRATNTPDDQQALGIAFLMVRRVARGRPPTGVDPVSDYVHGYPPSTMRRWRKVARDSAVDGHDDGGLSLALERLQRELDLAGLVRKGYALANARAWLRRNPGKHARDAPPPRRRRGDVCRHAGDQRLGVPDSEPHQRHED